MGQVEVTVIAALLSCPDLLGRPGAKGAALQASEHSFSEGQEQIVCTLAKGEAGNLRGKPKPARAGTAERSRRARELLHSQAQQRRAERRDAHTMRIGTSQEGRVGCRRPTAIS